jgi:membrane protein DedA with SNARE-associated domain
LIQRWGRYVGITETDLDRAETFFARYGEAASFFGRMVPVIRSLVSFAAGVARMPLGRFILFSFLGSLPFTALLVFAGVQLGANWESIGAILKRFEYAIVAVLAIVVVAWIWVRIIKPRRAARAIT